MNEEDIANAELTEQQALEAEFDYLHGQAAADLSAPGSLDERRRELRRKTHALADERAPWALCLSGGGIRSATFALGVVQGLAKGRLLTRFTYLSTVSGGGYIGSWLSRWILDAKGIDRVQSDLKDATPGTARGEPPQVSGLRAYSNYLSPVWGFSSDFFTLVSIVLRNLLLNWCVLLPLIAALLLLPYLYFALLGLTREQLVAWTTIGFAAVALIVGIGYIVTDLPKEARPAKPPRDRFLRFCFLPIFLAAILLSLALRWLEVERSWCTLAWAAGLGAAVHLLGNLGGQALYSRRLGISPQAYLKAHWRAILLGGLLVIVSGAAGGALVFCTLLFASVASSSDSLSLLYATLCVPALLLAFWLATTAYVALARHWSAEGEREWWARSGGWWIRASLLWAGGFALVVYVPQWLLQIPGVAALDAKTLVAGGGLWGLATGLIGYWSKNGSTITRRARRFADLVGARLLDLAAVAFILALLVVFCFMLSGVIGMWVPGEINHPPAELLARVVKTAQATESAARDSESLGRAYVEIQRLTGTKDATASPEAFGLAMTSLRDRSRELKDSTYTLPKATRNEMSEVIDALAKAERAALAASAPLSAIDNAVRSSMKEALAAIQASEHAVFAAVQVDESSGRITPAEYSRRIVAIGLSVRVPIVLPFLAPIWVPIQLILLLLFGGLLVVGCVFSFGVGVNTFSLHSMYGNRLVRAYLGAARLPGSRHPHGFTGFDNDDNVSMGQLLRDQAPIDKRCLFHVLNLTLNLTSAANDRLAWQQRKAASFAVTPLHCGSAAVGCLPSSEYAGPVNVGISLARAMAISGAAASPNMGYHSSAAVAFVMTLFNVRLGWWLPNPGGAGRAAWRRGEPGISALRLLVDEALGVSKVDRTYVYLSDGGHFENLGLYEMVKRRCRRILVVDASADPEYGYQDLQDAIRKIRVDFGIAIDFPQDSFAAPRRYTVGAIRYRDSDPDARQDGVLCYLKPALFGDEPLDVQRYAAASRQREPKDAFPHQSTADQFFDEAQFESYRMLGAHMVARMLAARVGCDLPAHSASDGTGVGSNGGDEADHAPSTSVPVGQPGTVAKLAAATRSMSQGAILASAITVGGVLGVSGTVALKDSTVALRDGAEVSISQQSRDDLRNMKLQLEPPKQIGGDPDIEALTKRVEEISKLLASAGSSQADLAAGVVKLGDLVDAIESRISTPEKRSVPDINGLSDAINGLKKSLEQVFLQADKGNRPRLQEIADSLQTIQESIDGAPRRTVRGVEGAGR